MAEPLTNPFPTVFKLVEQVGLPSAGYSLAIESTQKAAAVLRDALLSSPGGERLLNADASLILCGSYARHEMFEASDYDWSLLIDGVVDNVHAKVAESIKQALI